MKTAQLAAALICIAFPIALSAEENPFSAIIHARLQEQFLCGETGCWERHGSLTSGHGSMMKRFIPLALVLLAMLLGTANSAIADVTPTPRATQLVVNKDDENMVAIGYAEALPNDTNRIGIVFVCDKATRQLTARLSFGAFPSNKAVQAAAKAKDGRIERFGAVLRGSPASGFHAPFLEDEDDVLRMLDIAWQRDTLLSNGHNSVWNNLDEKTNREAKRKLLTCKESSVP